VEEHLSTALVEEATRKSALIWLRVGAADGTGGGDRAQAAWHVWADGAVFLVTGGAEQPLPGLQEALATRSAVTVTARSKDKGGRLVTYLARPSRVEPGTEEWNAAVAELHAKRLNAPDGEQQPARWARESTVVRLDPTGDLVELPGQMPAASGAAPPPASPATTIGALPFMLGGRRRRGRRR
jgi:hypothetical protein